MRVVIYLRVSTGKQVEEGLGLEVQEHACRAWARQHGHQVAGVHRDEGISGTKDLADRDGLADALEAIEDGRAHGLLVYRLDRLPATPSSRSNCSRPSGPTAARCCRPAPPSRTCATTPRTPPGG